MIQPQQLHLPTQRDPIARLALGVLAVAALLVAFAAPSVPADTAQAQVLATPQPIIVIATPTAPGHRRTDPARQDHLRAGAGRPASGRARHHHHQR